MKIALVLGGGGARGIAHLGVLKTLEKSDIQIDMIVGCSFGALIGGMYAQIPDAKLVEKRLREFLKTKEFKALGLHLLKKREVYSDDYLRQFVRNVKDWVLLNLLAQRMSILKAHRLSNAINVLIQEGKIEDTSIPFVCNATDLITGKPYLFTEGDMQTAIVASTTIPGYFPPIEINGRKLVDGAVTYNLPVDLARQFGADIVIGVDVHPVLHPENDFNNVFEVILRANTITANTLSDETISAADVIIQPPVKEYFWYEFDRAETILEAGEKATALYIEKILHLQELLQDQFNDTKNVRLTSKAG